MRLAGAMPRVFFHLKKCQKMEKHMLFFESESPKDVEVSQDSAWQDHSNLVVVSDRDTMLYYGLLGCQELDTPHHPQIIVISMTKCNFSVLSQFRLCRCTKSRHLIKYVPVLLCPGSI